MHHRSQSMILDRRQCIPANAVQTPWRRVSTRAGHATNCVCSFAYFVSTGTPPLHARAAASPGWPKAAMFAKIQALQAKHRAKAPKQDEPGEKKAGE